MQKQIKIKISEEEIIGVLHTTQKKDMLCIITHGFKGSNNDFVIRELSLKLEKNNISSFRPHLAKTTGENGFNSFELQSEIKKLKTCTAYFQNQFKKIVLIGCSMGGLISFFSAIDNKHISRIILINPFLYIFGNIAWKYRKLILFALFLYPFSKRIRSGINFYMKYFDPKLLSVPTLIICSRADRTVHYNQSVSFSKHLRAPHTLIIDTHMDHALTKKEYVTTAALHIVKWLS